MSSRKGSRRERELITALQRGGFTTMRAPSSGSATAADLPDLLAGDGRGSILAIEAKSGGDDNLYVTHEEVAALVRFGMAFGARPTLAGRWDGKKEWRMTHADLAYRTRSGNARLQKETARSEGYPTPQNAGGVIGPPDDALRICPRCDTMSSQCQLVTDSTAWDQGYTRLCETCFEALPWRD